VNFHLSQPSITGNSITVIIVAQIFWKLSSFPFFFSNHSNDQAIW